MILIADCGSSKTDWRGIMPDGTIIGQYKTIGFNPYYQDTTSIYQELQKNLCTQLEHPVNEIYFYGTGITNTEKKTTLINALQQAFPSASTIEVHSDMLGAARALCGQSAGIACILGTGANTCFYDGEQIAYQVPSLGFWLGDEGSGAHLGKVLIQAYLHQELPEELQTKFEKRFGKKDRLEILEHAYQKPFPNRYFASFSKFLFDNRNHPFCYQLISGAFRLFFDKYVLKYPNCSENKIHFIGSVAFYYSDILRRVAQEKQVSLGIIMETPIAGLALYHISRLTS